MNLAVLPFYPGIQAAHVSALLDSGVRGLLLECYGSGTGPSDDTELLAALKAAHERGVVLDVDASARAWLAEHGYDVAMGARPMARLIQDQVKKPLAEKLLFGELSEHGGKVSVTMQDDKLVLTVVEQAPEPAL